MGKKCRKCGAELPIPDMDCPNCGFDENYKSKFRILNDKYNAFFEGTSKGKRILFIVLYLYLIGMLIFIVYMSIVLFVL